MTTATPHRPQITMRDIIVSTPAILSCFGICAAGMIFVIQTNSTAQHNKQGIEDYRRLQRIEQARHEQRIQALEASFHNLDKNVAIMASAVKQQAEDVREIKEAIKEK